MEPDAEVVLGPLDLLRVHLDHAAALLVLGEPEGVVAPDVGLQSVALVVSRRAGERERGRLGKIVHSDPSEVVERRVLAEEEVRQVLRHGPTSGRVVVGLARFAARVEAGLYSFAKFLAVHEPRLQPSAGEAGPDTVLLISSRTDGGRTIMMPCLITVVKVS